SQREVVVEQIHAKALAVDLHARRVGRRVLALALAASRRGDDREAQRGGGGERGNAARHRAEVYVHEPEIADAPDSWWAVRGVRGLNASERETRLELATSTLARLRSTN